MTIRRSSSRQFEEFVCSITRSEPSDMRTVISYCLDVFAGIPAGFPAAIPSAVRVTGPPSNDSIFRRDTITAHSGHLRLACFRTGLGGTASAGTGAGPALAAGLGPQPIMCATPALLNRTIAALEISSVSNNDLPDGNAMVLPEQNDQ